MGVAWLIGGVGVVWLIERVGAVRWVGVVLYSLTDVDHSETGTGSDDGRSAVSTTARRDDIRYSHIVSITTGVAHFTSTITGRGKLQVLNIELPPPHAHIQLHVGAHVHLKCTCTCIYM